MQKCRRPSSAAGNVEMSRVRDVVHARESKLAAAAAAVAAAQQQAAQQLALGQQGTVGGSATGPFAALAKAV